MCTEAEALPFADRSFDLIFGHAVLHHIPDLSRAFSEFHRVLRPGRNGRVLRRAVALRRPDRGAAEARGDARGSGLAAPGRRLAGGLGDRGRPATATSSNPRSTSTPSAPASCGRSPATRASTGSGSAARSWSPTPTAGCCASLEATADPAEVPFRWRHFAHRSYIALQRLDTALLEPRLPPELFYNLVLSARRPLNTTPSAALSTQRCSTSSASTRHSASGTRLRRSRSARSRGRGASPPRPRGPSAVPR